MSREDDLRIVVEQERTLVFPVFNEAIAFEIGSALREQAIADGASLAVDIRTADRQLFYMALPGTSADHPHWLRRKANVVQRMFKSGYRVLLEHGAKPGDLFAPAWGLDVASYVMAGGGFPIWVDNAGMIGAICASGTNDRDEHSRVVEAIADHLGIDRTPLTLPMVS